MLYKTKFQAQPIEANPFSLSPELLHRILKRAKPLGHHTQVKNGNLGFGFLYYGLVRALRPNHIVVIGSGYGFSVVCLGLGLKDNSKGQLSFIDPSYSLLKNGPFHTVGGQSQWDHPQKVKEHFAQFGLEGLIRHFKMRSDRFFPDYARFQLPDINLAFIDGNHSYKDVRYDFFQVVGHSHKNSYIFLHDTNIYIREALGHAGVKRFVQEIKHLPDFFELLDFPFSSGVALVRVLQDKTWRPDCWPSSEQ